MEESLEPESSKKSLDLARQKILYEQGILINSKELQEMLKYQAQEKQYSFNEEEFEYFWKSLDFI